MENVCILCNKEFSKKRGLLKHNRNVHDICNYNKDRRKDEITNGGLRL